MAGEPKYSTLSTTSSDYFNSQVLLKFHCSVRVLESKSARHVTAMSMVPRVLQSLRQETTTPEVCKLPTDKVPILKTPGINLDLNLGGKKIRFSVYQP